MKNCNDEYNRLRSECLRNGTIKQQIYDFIVTRQEVFGKTVSKKEIKGMFPYVSDYTIRNILQALRIDELIIYRPSNRSWGLNLAIVNLEASGAILPDRRGVYDKDIRIAMTMEPKFRSIQVKVGKNFKEREI